MKAIFQERYGSPATLELRDVNVPVIKDDEVLVRVRAAGVNPADWAVMRGEPFIVRLATGLFKPQSGVGGMDVAGTVEAVGRRVTRLRPGDEVFGEGRGTFAERAAAAEKDLVLKPANLTFEQAAAVPMAALTALQALRDQGRVQPGQRVLINGAGGGIGTFAVQIAKALGAEVVAVCSPSKVDLVRSIGADHVVDYTREDFTQGGQRYDFILDNVGNHSLARVRTALTRRGTVVPNNGQFHNRWLGSLGSVIGARVLSLFVSHRLRPFLSLPKTHDLVELEQLLEAGKITPVLDRTYPLSETGKALAYVGEGHARGKVVVTV